MEIKQKLTSLFWFFKEIFFTKQGGIALFIYGIIQLLDTFIPRLPPEWGVSEMNISTLATLLLFVLLYVLWRAYQLSAHRFEFNVELYGHSNIPKAQKDGRYIVLIVRNNSPKEIRDFYMTIGRYWINGIEQLNLPLHVKRQDIFDWSSWEDLENPINRKGKKDFGIGQVRKIDIAELGREKNQVRVTLQTEYDIIGNTEGSYRIEAIIHAVYNGGKIEFPVFVDFGYKGKKAIENRINVFPANKDRRVEILPSKVIV